MATIHTGTTMAPTKLELLTDWLPGQPWYGGTGEPPVLSRAGGFRLDDPAGEVGIEFAFVSDGDTTYHVPMTYRSTPLRGAEQGLIGTSEHGVLGPRWIYDAAHDPVAVTQLLAFLQGDAEAQHQSQSDTADPSVGRSGVPGSRLSAPGVLEVSNTERGTTALTVELTSPTAPGVGELTLDVIRVPAPGAFTGLGHVEADWTRPDRGSARGPVVVVW